MKQGRDERLKKPGFFFFCLFVNENWVEARTGGEINGDNADENRGY